MQYFLLVLFLLGVSAIAGKRVQWLKRFAIPPSLTMGIGVLLFFTFLPQEKTGGFFVHLKSLPSEFIALVFACLFLQRTEATHTKRKFAEVLGQVSLVWVSVMGQVLIGLVGTILIFKPFFGEPMAFTSVLETGFAGGHGTAVAMGPILVQNGIAAGLEYGLFSATIGLILGIVGGVWLIHHQKRKLHLKKTEIVEENHNVEISLHTLLVSFALIAAAYWLGQLFKGIFEREVLPQVLSPDKLRGFSLPLFAYTLMGGYAVKHLCQLARVDYLIDNRIILLAADVFLEILIFAGIAIIDVRLLGHALVPLLTVFAFGFVWNVFCHFYVRPRMLPVPYSFELGLINFGMLNGTAATGLMLLKMIDPQFKTPAARVFAESSAITQPFIAGGILTLLTPYIVTELNPWLSVALFGGLLSFWLVFGLSTGKRIAPHRVD